ncbi:acyltransferase [Saccharopolyspora gloriosae]|uniref:acyltransferase family protein n=1 Tax=Saccharopolyspora gloriosae TaxID=455344 RepID=UPI001FB78F2A|nr:acyltransferase [Saccharopolyspora gloriosae]
MGTLRVEHAHPERFADPAHGFAWIRMIGALLVIYGHSSPLAGSGELFPPEWPLQPDEGVLMGFFAMSGFQITESWIRDPHPVRFAAKRVLRLWPPMLTVTLGLALIVGPLVTTLTAGEYFAARDTWGYIVNNAGLLTLKHELPGVFTENPWPGAVNGSLWTLPMELLAYGGLYALLLAGAAKQRWRWLAVVALAALVVWDRYLEQQPGAESAGSMLSVPVEPLVAFLVAFAFGVVLNLYRIPLSMTAAVTGLAVLAAMPNSISASFLMVFAASYAVVVAGHFWPARLTVPGFLVNGSYGVYVWGFPVQQLLAMAGVANQYLMLLCAAPIAYVLGTLSWVFVEEPTMRLRHYIAPETRRRSRRRDSSDGQVRGDSDRRDGRADDRDRYEDDGWDETWPQEDPAPAPARGFSGELGPAADEPAPPRGGRHARRPDPPAPEEETRPLGRVFGAADHP